MLDMSCAVLAFFFDFVFFVVVVVWFWLSYLFGFYLL